MPEATSAGGGYSCQVCGITYATEGDLIQHGRDQYPNQPVMWEDPREATVRSETTYEDTKNDTQRDLEDAGAKMKAGAKAIGSKISDPDRDLKAEYEQKKAEERAK